MSFPIPEHPDKAFLKKLLLARNQTPGLSGEIDATIRQAFEREVAILVLDMSGFSRLTRQHGILHYLAMIVQMEAAARPAITANGGTTIKQEADNLYAVFNHPTQGVEAARDIFRAFDAINSVMPTERDIYGCIGIGYGPTLVIGEEDLFGDEMNFACRLGEDLAHPAQILLTPRAFEALPKDRYVCTPLSFSVADEPLTAYEFSSRLFPSGGNGGDPGPVP